MSSYPPDPPPASPAASGVAVRDGELEALILELRNALWLTADADDDALVDDFGRLWDGQVTDDAELIADGLQRLANRARARAVGLRSGDRARARVDAIAACAQGWVDRARARAYATRWREPTHRAALDACVARLRGAAPDGRAS